MTSFAPRASGRTRAIASFSLLSGLAVAFTAADAQSQPSTATASAAPSTTPFSVRIVGKGRPMLLIPGLTNGAAVWNSTVDALKNEYELHVFTLAGFAGQPAVAVDSTWLPRMRDSIIAYAQRQKLRKPVIMGHSLGGFLALDIARTAPDLASAIVNVDGLPFLGATQDTSASPASVRPQADAMRKMMAGGNAAGYASMQAAQLRSMLRDTASFPAVLEMGRASDMRTTAEAMYGLYTTDLRPTLSTITVPVLNLHAWVAYKAYGVTRASTEAMLASQYRALRTGTTRLNDASYHFIMYDEPRWMLDETRAFLAAKRAR